MSLEIAIIRRAREIISDPESWCRGSSARDADNEECPVFSPRACKRCAWGALLKAASELTDDDPFKAADRAAVILDHSVNEHGVSTITSLNDNGGHAAVLSLFDKALAEA